MKRQQTETKLAKFRSKPVQGYLFPEQTRSPYFRWPKKILFPEHVHSLLEISSFVISTFRSIPVHGLALFIFRSIPVHSNVLSYLCRFKIAQLSKGSASGFTETYASLQKSYLSLHLCNRSVPDDLIFNPSLRMFFAALSPYPIYDHFCKSIL
jgi:hypothetical protein